MIKPGWPVLATTAVAVVGALFAVDARYLHRAEAAELTDRMGVAREVGDLETQRELILLELKTGNPDDERRAYLRARLQIIEARLTTLKAAQ